MLHVSVKDGSAVSIADVRVIYAKKSWHSGNCVVNIVYQSIIQLIFLFYSSKLILPMKGATLFSRVLPMPEKIQ